MRQHAAIYRHRKRYIIHPFAKTTAGVFVLAEPCIALGQACENAELGAAVRAALAQPLRVVSHPRQNEWNLVAAPLLAAAGVKSWTGFARGATLASVEEDDAGVVRLQPMWRDGGGFVAAPGVDAIELPMETDDALGAAIRHHFEDH